MKYQRGTETPIECISVAELLDEAEQEQMPVWVAEAAAKGQLKLRRNAIDIVGGRFAAQALRTDMLCFDETKDDGDQIFYLSGIQFKKFKPVEQ